MKKATFSARWGWEQAQDGYNPDSALEAEGYRPPTIAKMLKSEGIFVSRRGVAKFYQEYTCSCWASSSKTRERNYTCNIRACVHSPVPENGNGKIKTKWEYIRNGPFRSSPIQFLFNTCSLPVFLFLFLNGRPLYG